MVTVLAGHLLHNSQGSRSQNGLSCKFQPVLAGHLSITATFCGPEGDHYRQVPLYFIVFRDSAHTVIGVMDYSWIQQTCVAVLMSCCMYVSIGNSLSFMDMGVVRPGE